MAKITFGQKRGKQVESSYTSTCLKKKITRPLAPFHDGTSCSFTLACLISIIIERLSKSKRCFSRPRWKLAQTANLARSSAWFRGIGVQISFVDGIIPDFVCFEKYFTFILPSRNAMSCKKAFNYIYEKTSTGYELWQFSSFYITWIISPGLNRGIGRGQILNNRSQRWRTGNKTVALYSHIGWRWWRWRRRRGWKYRYGSFLNKRIRSV